MKRFRMIAAALAITVAAATPASAEPVLADMAMGLENAPLTVV